MAQPALYSPQFQRNLGGTGIISGIRSIVDIALMQGMGAEFELRKRGQKNTLILEQPPAQPPCGGTALYPDLPMDVPTGNRTPVFTLAT